MVNPIEITLQILTEFLKEDDVLAVMVKSKGMPAISPPINLFKLRDFRIWQQINASMEHGISFLNSFSGAGADKLYLEIANYEVIFFVLNQNAVLVVVVPVLANRGLIGVQIENTRRSLKKIL